MSIDDADHMDEGALQARRIFCSNIDLHKSFAQRPPKDSKISCDANRYINCVRPNQYWLRDDIWGRISEKEASGVVSGVRLDSWVVLGAPIPFLVRHFRLGLEIIFLLKIRNQSPGPVISP